MSQGAEEWFSDQAARVEQLRSLIKRIPFADQLLPEEGQFVEQFREVAGRTGPALMGTVVAAATRGALSFGIQLFILLYALFFFLVDGPLILRTILSYIPLSETEKEELLERFVSVTRVTVKGSLLIGVIQGGVAGLVFSALTNRYIAGTRPPGGDTGCAQWLRTREPGAARSIAARPWTSTTRQLFLRARPRQPA